MYLKLGKKKIMIYEYNKFSERFKSLRFVLDKIDYGIKMPRKKMACTYFFCQKVDICFTDKHDNILSLYSGVKTEKRIIKLKARNVYFLPLNSAKELSVGDKLVLYE